MLLDPENGTFRVGCIYGRADDAPRFSYFCGAAAEYLRIADIKCAAHSLSTIQGLFSL